MSQDEQDNILNSVFPIGEERWVKIKYHDRKKCMQNFRLSPPHEEQLKLFIENKGYEVTALGIRDGDASLIDPLLRIRENMLQECSYKGGHLDFQDLERLFNEGLSKEFERMSIFPL